MAAFMPKTSLAVVDALLEINDKSCRLAHECHASGPDGKPVYIGNTPKLRDVCPAKVQGKMLGCAHSEDARDIVIAALEAAEKWGLMSRARVERLRKVVDEEAKKIIGFDGRKMNLAIAHAQHYSDPALREAYQQRMDEFSQKHEVATGNLADVRTQLLRVFGGEPK